MLAATFGRQVTDRPQGVELDPTNPHGKAGGRRNRQALATNGGKGLKAGDHGFSLAKTELATVTGESDMPTQEEQDGSRPAPNHVTAISSMDQNTQRSPHQASVLNSSRHNELAQRLQDEEETYGSFIAQQANGVHNPFTENLMASPDFDAEDEDVMVNK